MDPWILNEPKYSQSFASTHCAGYLTHCFTQVELFERFNHVNANNEAFFFHLFLKRIDWLYFVGNDLF